MKNKFILISVISVILVIIILAIFLNLDNLKVDIDYTEYFEIVEKYPHNTSSFTEGLFFFENELYESTGNYGKSYMYKNIDLNTGIAESEYKLDEKIFGEGAIIFNEKLYLLTYKENKVLVFDYKTLEEKQEIEYSREGWGLTTDGKYLIASDGSSQIYFMDENINDIKNITVRLYGVPIDKINELEYVNGKIFANVFKTDYILIINPKNGEVEKRINFENLNNCSADVLNGIAWNNNKMYITGKYWDTLYELKLKNKLKTLSYNLKESFFMYIFK